MRCGCMAISMAGDSMERRVLGEEVSSGGRIWGPVLDSESGPCFEGLFFCGMASICPTPDDYGGKYWPLNQRTSCLAAAGYYPLEVAVDT